MTCPQSADQLRRAAALVLLAISLWGGRALAADMPEDFPEDLRGPIWTEERLDYADWSGINFGVQAGWSNLTTDFRDAVATTSLGQTTTNSATFGAFLGYNVQWEHLVVGIDGAYNRPSSLATSVSNGTATANYKLVDYATFRGRAGYAFGQFLPYGFAGAAAGRFNYSVTSGGATNSRDNAYAVGFTAGLGLDVAILPNLFVRAEYEYVAFSPLGGIRSSLNTARAGLGLRF